MAEKQPKLLIFYFPEKWNAEQMEEAAGIIREVVSQYGDKSLIFSAPVDKVVPAQLLGFNKHEFVDLLKKTKIIDLEYTILQEENEYLVELIKKLIDDHAGEKVSVPNKPWGCPGCEFETDSFDLFREHVKTCQKWKVHWERVNKH